MYYKKFSITLIFSIIFLNIIAQYKEKEIAIYTNPDSLYGTLLLTKNKNYLVIFHSGSGPTDRDGNNEYGGNNNSIKKLADSLAKYQIPSFRYDKRGIGKSKDALISEDSLTIQDYVKDLLMWIKFFSNKQYGFKNFILIGHSEGALISTLAAQKSEAVKKIILLAGAGYRADTIIKRQMSNLQDDAKKIIFSIIDTLAKGKKVENIPPILSSLFRESVQNYMISWLPIDPAIELSKLKIPALIIQGENDIQVSVKDAERLKEYKKDATLKIIPQMNHVLVDASKDKKENIKTYSNPDLSLSKELIPILKEFILKK